MKHTLAFKMYWFWKIVWFRTSICYCCIRQPWSYVLSQIWFQIKWHYTPVRPILTNGEYRTLYFTVSLTGYRQTLSSTQWHIYMRADQSIYRFLPLHLVSHKCLDLFKIYVHYKVGSKKPWHCLRQQAKHNCKVFAAFGLEVQSVPCSMFPFESVHLIW